MCDEDVKSEDHVFLSGEIAVNTWQQVIKWWKLANVTVQNLQDVIN